MANFFIELIGNTNTGKLGGAHLCLKNDIDFFVYHYISNGSFYWFRPKDLVEFIEKHKKEFKELKKSLNDFINKETIVSSKSVTMISKNKYSIIPMHTNNITALITILYNSSEVISTIVDK